MRRTLSITAAAATMAALILSTAAEAAAQQAAPDQQRARQPAGAAADAHGEEHAEIPKEAVAVLAPTKGNEVQGVVLMKQHEGYVEIVGKVVGLTPGKHGFHIHQYGDLRHPEGLSAGGHYNPTGEPHGGPHEEKRHVGDLGNITANDDGVAEIRMEAKGMKLHFVIGRAMVVHGEADDLMSQPSGDAGPRVALGVIGFAEVKEKQE